MKRFRTKKRSNKLIIIIFGIIFLIVFVLVSFCRINKSYDMLVHYMLKNHTFYEKEESVLLSKISSNLDYLLPLKSFKEIKQEFREDEKQTIYLYNTHHQEKYKDNTTVVDATIKLQDNLKRLGLHSYVEEKKVSDYLHTGLSNYDISKTFLLEALKDNYRYYIDIHRDSVSNTTIEINHKKYAKILFVLGKDNPSYEENKKVMTKMNDYLNENYPGLSKGIYEKSGNLVDGKYNQDVNKNVLLIEIGGVDNTIDEVNNSTETYCFNVIL